MSDVTKKRGRPPRFKKGAMTPAERKARQRRKAAQDEQNRRRLQRFENKREKKIRITAADRFLLTLPVADRVRVLLFRAQSLNLTIQQLRAAICSNSVADLPEAVEKAEENVAFFELA